MHFQAGLSGQVHKALKVQNVEEGGAEQWDGLWLSRESGRIWSSVVTF